MTPYVLFQEHVIRVLRAINEKDSVFLRRLVKGLHKNSSKVPSVSLDRLFKEGLTVAEAWHMNELPKILKEQIVLDRKTVTIRNLLGHALYDYGLCLNFEEYFHIRGSGQNRLRTTHLAQPGALKVGDILATGDRVLSEPREGGNGAVLLHLTGGFDGRWISVPSRIPISLLTKEDKVPDGYIEK
jgi:hypothetical protein